MEKIIHKIPYLGYYTRVYTFGDVSKSIPLIILHGGPGGCAERYEPLEKLADFGIPLIFYDQLGCGYSKVPKNHKITWNFQVFLNELDNLIDYFGLKKFYILGHSWGGMLAMEWAVNHPNSGLEKLILFSTLPSTKIWNEEHLKMINDFPNTFKEAIMLDYECKPCDNKMLRLGVKQFYREHVGKKSTEFYNFKAKKFPKTNREIYEKMWGKSELFGTGTLKDWSVEDKISDIKVPTLILSGAFDESTPRMNELMNKKIRDSKWILLEKSHHIGYAEEAEFVIKALKEFIFDEN